MSDSRDVIIETFVNPGEASSKRIRARPVPGQKMSPDIRVRCSSTMRGKYPVGTKFKIAGTLTDKEGGKPFFTCHHKAPYRVVTDAQARAFIRKTQPRASARKTRRPTNRADSSERNPAWNRDELILALDLYFREPNARGSKTHPKVIALSELLNRLPIHPGIRPGTTFRNPNGVGMKLSNFLRYDPTYKGKGLERGAKLEATVWKEFADDRKQLRQVAEAIQENYKALGEVSPSKNEDISDDEEAVEGRVLTRIHKFRERDTKIVKKKKAKVLSETGRLACEACGFDFQKRYGKLGEGFAECHHERPLSELKRGEKTKIRDLRIVCANCHRMIHRSRPWPTVAEFANLFSG